MDEREVPIISIDGRRCSGDGLCARICPVRVFDREVGGPPRVRHPEECCACGQCMAACPRDAILHDRFTPASFSDVETSQLSHDSVLQLLATRRSVRLYRDEAPSREVLEKVIQTAGFAPGSPHRRIGWVRSFVVVTGEEALRTVREMTAEYVRLSHRYVTGWLVRTAARFNQLARAAQAVAPDLDMRRREWEAGRDVISWNAPAIVFAHAPTGSSMPQPDCDAALFSVLLAAHAHGLGACWNGLLQSAAAGEHLKGFDRLHRFLGIPEGSRCYAAATIGYPAVKYRKVPRRPVAISWLGA